MSSDDLGLDDDNTLRKRCAAAPRASPGVYPHHHEPYISWEMYEQHQQMIAAHAHRMAPKMMRWLRCAKGMPAHGSAALWPLAALQGAIGAKAVQQQGICVGGF